MWGRFGEVVLNVSPDGKWWLQLREGRREVGVAAGLDSKQAQAHIAKFMAAMAALAVRGAKVADGSAIDAVVPPPVPHAGEVVEFPLAEPPKRKGRPKATR